MAPVICCMVHTAYGKSDFSSFSHHPVWGQLLWSLLCFQDHSGRDTRQETSVSIWLMITPRAEGLNAMPRFMQASPETRAKTASESSDFISRALSPSPGLPPTDLRRSEKRRTTLVPLEEERDLELVFRWGRQEEAWGTTPARTGGMQAADSSRWGRFLETSFF